MVPLALGYGVVAIGFGMAALGGLMVVAVGRAGWRAFGASVGLGALSLICLLLARLS